MKQPKLGPAAFWGSEPKPTGSKLSFKKICDSSSAVKFQVIFVALRTGTLEDVPYVAIQESIHHFPVILSHDMSFIFKRKSFVKLSATTRNKPNKDGEKTENPSDL